MVTTLHSGMIPSTQSAQAGEQILVVGEHIRLIATADQTGGACSVFEMRSLFGGGVPVHTHTREDEIVLVLEGSYDITLGARVHHSPAGASATFPRGVPHGFRCTSPRGGRLLVIATPGGFEHFLRDLAADVPEIKGERDLERARAIFERYGMTLA